MFVIIYIVFAFLTGLMAEIPEYRVVAEWDPALGTLIRWPLGIPSDLVQDNQELSGKNTLRGLHYQLKYPQGKLIQVTLGKVYDISLDIRHGSPTFGLYFGIVLSDKNFNIVYVPEGFDLGYSVLSDTAIFQYKCTETYHPEDEHGIKWNDLSIHINWQITNPIISEKDLALPSLTELGPSLLPAYRVQK